MPRIELGRTRRPYEGGVQLGGQRGDPSAATQSAGTRNAVDHGSYGVTVQGYDLKIPTDGGRAGQLLRVKLIHFMCHDHFEIYFGYVSHVPIAPRVV